MSALYMLTMYQDMFFPYKGHISSIQRLTPEVLEIRLKLTNQLNYRPGQFLFLKVFQEGSKKHHIPSLFLEGMDNKSILR